MNRQLARASDRDAGGQGSAGHARRGRSDPPGASLVLQRLEGLDDARLAPGLGSGDAAATRHLFEPEKKLLAVDHGGRANFVATQPAHEVVGLAAADSKESLDGRAVDKGHPHRGQVAADLRKVGVPTGFSGHRSTIPLDIRYCALAQ